MKRSIGFLLIIVGIGLGIFGFTKLDDSEAGIEIGNLEIKAEDQEARNDAYVWIGLGFAGLLGGIFLVNKKS
ncbi:MAG: hypothetical protein IPJ74_11870 [Saprospiraceae bacterium]|nr:hypothetical protein [Saprospiraceae bacterium]